MNENSSENNPSQRAEGSGQKAEGSGQQADSLPAGLKSKRTGFKI